MLKEINKDTGCKNKLGERCRTVLRKEGFQTSDGLVSPFWRQAFCLRSGLLIWGCVTFLSCSQAPIATGHLANTAHAHVPATIQVSGAESDQTYCVNFTGGQSYPLEVSAQGEAVFVPQEDLAEDATWEVLPCENRNALSASNEEGLLTFSNANGPILSFSTEVKLPHDTTPAYYARDGFIHPFYSPKGVPLTESYPRGHTHQHGIFHAWTRSTIEGQMVDFWNQHAQLGTVRLADMGELKQGPVLTSFDADLEYLAYINSDTIIAAHEEWNVVLYSTDKINVADIWIIHTPSIDSLILNEYHYGGFGVRANDEWNMEGTSLSPYDSLAYIKTSLGDTHATANHTRPTWISMWGEIGGKTAGLTVLPHPENFRYPQPVRVHPSMPYFTFAPMVLGEFVLTPQTPYVAKYLLISYDGEPDENLIEQLRAAYR